MNKDDIERIEFHIDELTLWIEITEKKTNKFYRIAIPLKFCEISKFRSFK